MSETTPPQAPPPPASPGRVRPPLRRSRTDRKLTGVAGGLATYFDIDPLLVRIGFVVLALSGAGIGVLLYVACLLLIPQEGDDVSEARYFVDRHGRLLATIAGIAIVVALLAASGTFGWGDHRSPWPLIVVAIGVAIFVIVRNDRRGRPAFGPPVAPTGVPSPSPYAASYVAASTAAQSTVPVSSMPPPASPYAASFTPPYPPYPPYPPRPPLPPWKPRERSALGPLTFGAALVTAGTLVGLDRGGVVDVPTVVVLASALAVVGLGLVVGGLFGRSRGLIALAVVLTVATAIAGVVHLPGTNSTGDQTWAPLTAAEVVPRYEWGAGDTVLDLGAVSSPTTVSTSVHLGVGTLKVVLPPNATARVRAHVGAGEILLQQPRGNVVTTDGINRTVTSTLGPSIPASPAEARLPATTFDLDLEVGLGQLEVSHA